MSHRFPAILLSALLAASALSAQSYSVASGALASYPLVNTGTTLALADDDLSSAISPAGFSFRYFGAYYSSFQVGTNGYIILGGSGVTTSPAPVHSTAPGLVVAACWVDLEYPVGGTSWVRWRFDQGLLQVEWNNMAKGGGPSYSLPPPSLDMVVTLDTVSGIITFEYGFPGASTVGVTSALPYTIAISGPSGAGQEVIPAYDPGKINADGSVSAWPQLRYVRFTPAGANTAPGLGVTSNGSPVPDGSTLNVALNSALSSLALSIQLSDADADMVSVNGSVTNIGTSGIDATEFNSTAAATPYSLQPAAGTFNVSGTTHSVSLTAGDGRGGVASLSFDIVVGGAPVNTSPQIAVTVGGAPVISGAIVQVSHQQALAALNLQITISDAEADPTSVTGSVGNQIGEGILASEFSNAAAGVPYTLAPTSGAFIRHSVSLPVTLIATDGISPPALFSFTLQVSPVLVGGASMGGGGGGGCVAGAASLPLALLALPIALLRRARRKA